MAQLCRCTIPFTPKREVVMGKKSGPDEGWDLLRDEELRTFCNAVDRKLIHRGRSTYHHVCAYFGEWAFAKNDQSDQYTVVFLHYKTPRKLAGLLGEPELGAENKVFEFTGAQLYAAYTGLKTRGLRPHVWKRKSQGEIAIDFCLADTHCF